MEADSDLLAKLAEEASTGERKAVPSVRAITAAEEDLGRGAISCVLPLAHLAHDIAEAILDGRRPPGLTEKRLRRLPELPLD